MYVKNILILNNQKVIRRLEIRLRILSIFKIFINKLKIIIKLNYPVIIHIIQTISLCNIELNY